MLCVRSFVLPAAVVVVLSGCGTGSGGTASTPIVAMPGSGAASTAVMLTVTVPAARTAAASARHPSYISPSTNGMVVSVATSGGTVVTTVGIDLSSTSTACSAIPNGRLCRAPVQASPGNDTFTLTTYDEVPTAAGAVGPGAHQLGLATVAKSIAAGVSNAIGAAIGGIVARATIAAPAALFGAAAGTERLTVTLEDADANVIVAGTTTATNDGVAETDTYSNPVTLAAADSTGGGPHTTLDLNGGTPAASVTLTKSSDVVTLHYDGKAVSPYHATVSTTVASSTTSLASARFAPLFIASSGPNAATYAVSSNGSPSIALTSAYEPLALTATEDTITAANLMLTIANAQRANGAIACPTASLFVTSATTAGAFTLAGGRYSTNGAGCALAISDGTTSVLIPTTVAAVAKTLYVTIPFVAGSMQDEVEIVAVGNSLNDRRIDAATDTSFPSPLQGVTHDPSGNVYASSGYSAASSTASYLVAYPSGGTSSSSFVDGESAQFGGLIFDDGPLGVVTAVDSGAQGAAGPDFESYPLPLVLQEQEFAYGETGNAVAIAEDQAGKIYLGEVLPAAFASQKSVRVYQPVTASGEANRTDLPTALPHPALDLACDAAGNLYVADGSTVTEYAVDLSKGTLTQIHVVASGNVDPRAVAVGGDGTVYVGVGNVGAIDVYTPNGTGGFTMTSVIVLDGVAAQIRV